MINNLFLKVKEHHFIINLIVLALLYFVNIFWQGIVFVIAPYLLIIVFLEGKLKGFYYLSFSVAFVCIFKLGTNIYLLLIIGAIYLGKRIQEDDDFIIRTFKRKKDEITYVVKDDDGE